MPSIKEIVELEASRPDKVAPGELHLWKEGTFMRAYDWSAWLACRFLNDFKVTKRTYKGLEGTVAFIGFPETSLKKWLPEGSEQRVAGEKHLVLVLPETIISGELAEMQIAYAEWKEQVPVAEAKDQARGGREEGTAERSGRPTAPVTLSAVMQRILAWPIEERSLMENTRFLSEVRRQLAALV